MIWKRHFRLLDMDASRPRLSAGIARLLATAIVLLITGCTGMQALAPAPRNETDAARRACLAQPSGPCLRAQAFTVADDITNPIVRDALMKRIAANQLLHGELDAGLRSATRIHDLSARYALLTRVHGELNETAPAHATQLKQRMHRLNQTHLPYNRAIGGFYLAVLDIAANHGAGVEKARDTIDAYLRRYGRQPERTVAQFAVTLFEQGHRELAFELVRSLQQLHWQSFALGYLAKGGYATAGFARELDALVGRARAEHNTGALQRLAVALAHRQDWQRAVALANAIEHSYYRAQTLTDIAAIAATRGEVKLADPVWRDALALAPAADAARPDRRDVSNPPVALLVAEGIKQLAVTTAVQGHFDAALRHAGRIAALSPVTSDAAYARLVSEMALAGEFDAARRSARLIVSADKRDLALANLAIRLHAAGQPARAFQMIFALEHRPALDHALGEIALAQARDGHWDYALQLGDRIRLAFKYADLLNRLAVLKEEQALALATPSHMRIIRAFARTRPRLPL